MNLGSLTSEDESRAIMDESLEIGINSFDAADALVLVNS
jgi:aryl-alcohol dehydrogenase-like predicted oxidoreductase